MTMPKKGSRTIEVRGQQYRYMLRGHARYEGNCWTRPTLTVEADTEKPGQVAKCEMIYKPTGGQEPDVAEGQKYAKGAVKPRHVKKMVEMALDGGWTPEMNGAPFKVSNQEFGGECDFKPEDEQAERPWGG